MNIDNEASPPIFVSRDEAARLLSISVRSVIRLEEAGRLTPVRLNPNSKFGRVLIKRSEIAALGDE